MECRRPEKLRLHAGALLVDGLVGIPEVRHLSVLVRESPQSAATIAALTGNRVRVVSWGC